MIGLTLASLWARRRRMLSIAVAVALGVAFLTGTLVLGDTLDRNFDRLFTRATAGTDVVVRNATIVDPGNAEESNRGVIDGSLLARVRAVPGVAAADAQLVGYGSLIGRDGEAIGGNGPPRLAGSWIGDPKLNPYRLVEGRAPRAADEVVVNRGAAESGDLHLGDITTVQTPEAVKVRIVGIATFGDADGLGRTTWTAFTLPSAQDHLIGTRDKVSTILVRAAPGVTSAELRTRIAAQLPPGVQAITGAQLTEERVDEIATTFLDMLRTFMVAFAAIALLVATLTINNTFSIVVAQRTGELAVLRAVGASRRQLRRSVTLEALVVGGLAALVGAVGGLGVAALLKAVFAAFGGSLPAGGLDVRPLSLAIGVVVGVAVTVVAAQIPSRRASAVPPIAALREASVERAAVTRRRAVLGGSVFVLGLATAVVASSAGAWTAAVGGVALLVGALVLAPVALPGAARLMGGALRRVRGVNGVLATENARRNPRRSAATASALVVGVAVVTLITVLVASLETTLKRDVRAPFIADLAVNTSSFGGSRLSPRVVPELQALPQVARAVAVGDGVVLVDGESNTVSDTDVDAVQRLVRVRADEGSLRSIGTTGIAVSRTAADDHEWTLGRTLSVTFADGAVDHLRVGAIYDDNEILGDLVVADALWTRHTAQPTERSVFVTARAGVNGSELRRAVDPVAARFGGDVQNQDEYADAAAGGFDFVLGIVYVLLLLAIVIALLGIANTLSLAVFERRREIGLLRAVGETRRQVRSVLRLESFIVATFGTVIGVVVGSVVGWSLFEAIASGSTQFSLPVARLATILVIGAVAGVLAGWRPSRRAARIPVLEAAAVQ